MKPPLIMLGNTSIALDLSARALAPGVVLYSVVKACETLRSISLVLAADATFESVTEAMTAMAKAVSGITLLNLIFISGIMLSLISAHPGLTGTTTVRPV